MITLKDWVTSSGKYPERAKELTPDVVLSAEEFLILVNDLLEQLGIASASVSSGFRPASVNSKIPNAAKRSAHMSGKAIDLIDIDGSLKKLIASKPEIMRKLGLFLEDPASTPTWCHVDCVVRADRPSRIFKP